MVYARFELADWKKKLLRSIRFSFVLLVTTAEKS